MTPEAVLFAVLRYGPDILPVIQQIEGWIKTNKTEVTADDIAVLVAYGRKTSAEYLAEAGGAPTPAPTPAPAP